MLSLFISILGIFITIFLVIGVHEFGHFITARLCGIKVLRFSIGFGKTLWRRYDKKGTEYVLAAIPLGGYVKMLDEAEEPVKKADLPYSYSRQPIYKRIAVIAAGPLFNFIFAFFLYYILFIAGFTTIIPVTGTILPNSVASIAGMKPQEEILQIDQRPVTTWYSIVIRLLERTGDKNNLKIETKNLQSKTQSTYSLDLSKWHMDDLKPDPLESLGIEPFQPDIPAVIFTMQENSPAQLSGLKVGDKILSLDKKPVKNWIDLITYIIDAPEQTFQVELLRDGKAIILPVKIGYKRSIFYKKTGYLGIAPNAIFPKELLREEQYNPWQAIFKASEEVRNFTYLNFIILGKMVTGKVSIQSLGGPITIFESAGNALNNGLVAFMSFLAFLSISIGVINVLPIPGLDGGHLFFQVIESIRGKPISERTLLLCYRLGLALLLVLIIQSLSNDLMRAFG
jgi:regulator of sigma E protease